MPEREIRIADFCDAFWIDRILDVEQDSISGARTSCQSDFRVDHDVVATAALGHRLRPGSRVAALVETSDRTSRRVGEHTRMADDLRVLRRGKRHLDHVDAEERSI